MTEQELDVRELMELCLTENDRRFAGYDLRLLRPTTIPTLVGLALKLMPKPKGRRLEARDGIGRESLDRIDLIHRGRHPPPQRKRAGNRGVGPTAPLALGSWSQRS